MTTVEERIPYDVMDVSGSWMKTFSPKPGFKLRTLSGGRWNGMSKRCNGKETRWKGSHYKFCQNGFSNFDEFAEWSMSQFGYRMRNTNGSFFHLDKDILSPGNTIYSPERCCFVSSRINNLIFTSYRKNNDLPIGVCKQLNCRTYTARANRDGKLIQLGGFYDPMEAHHAWQRFRADEIARVSLIELRDGRINKRIYEALINISEIFMNDASNGRQTNFRMNSDD